MPGAIEMAQDSAYGKQTHTSVNVNAEMNEIDCVELAKRIEKLKAQYKSDY